MVWMTRLRQRESCSGIQFQDTVESTGESRLTTYSVWLMLRLGGEPWTLRIELIPIRERLWRLIASLCLPTWDPNRRNTTIEMIFEEYRD
jgi:hypothetical protein